MQSKNLPRQIYFIQDKNRDCRKMAEIDLVRTKSYFGSINFFMNGPKFA